MRILVWLALIVYGLSAPVSVWAQACVPLPVAEQALEQMGRVQVGRGVAGQDGVVVLYVSADGAWNLVLVRPQGFMCSIAGGDDWEVSPPKPPGTRS